ncbi:MAG TPA: LacI family DNA-binding transcriptional regulator [bacterium]|nr:LacI family DNA-binding transcriptional regulator [bacterium]
MLKKNVTQKDIAQALNISRGTVDRALHNRKGISPRVKARVIAKATALGYSPNKIAQFLVTGRSVNIAIITPGDLLWKKVKQGAKSFLSVLDGRVVNIKWHQTSVHDAVKEQEIMKSVLADAVDGIGIAPADPEILRTLIDEAVETDIPVVTLNTDSPKSRRLCYVGQDPIRAGRIAGELMGKFLVGKGKVIVITAFANVLVHKLRIDGFRQELAASFPEIQIVGIYEDRDSSAKAYSIVKKILLQKEDIQAIYLTTGNGPAGVGRALKEAQKCGSIKVICFDFFPETIDMLKDGTVSAAIGEDPYGQGYQTIKILYEFIVDGRKPSSDSVYTKIDIGLRGNIDSLVG